jgi:CRP/FNR family transcriptional regulator
MKPDDLKNNITFSKLSEDSRKTLVGLANQRDYSKGEWITHYGDVWPHLFYIEYGGIQAVKESMEGRSLIVTQFDPGELFWGLAFFIVDAPTPAALVATQDTRIQIWSRENFLPFLFDNGRLSWDLTTLVVNKLLQASDLVEGLAFQPIAGRLANFLVERFSEGEGDKVSRDLTLDEMAAHIGTTREMVCRMLHKFSTQGFIELTRTEFIFTDREGLRQIAQNT